MTQLECPQCHSEIAACPHCGFSLEEADLRTEAEQQKSPLGAPVRNMAFGITFIVAGVLGLVGSLFLIMTTLFGLVFFVLCALAIALGISMIIGYAVADCPFCGQKIQVTPQAHSVTCNHCKTVSICKGDYLELL